jgi:hypothetical protein
MRTNTLEISSVLQADCSAQRRRLLLRRRRNRKKKRLRALRQNKRASRLPCRKMQWPSNNKLS